MKIYSSSDAFQCLELFAKVIHHDEIGLPDRRVRILLFKNKAYVFGN
jgi:hypothetical protein